MVDVLDGPEEQDSIITYHLRCNQCNSMFAVNYSLVFSYSEVIEICPLCEDYNCVGCK